MFAFDWDSSGKQDHLVLYRPGARIFWVMQNSGGAFSAVYTSGNGVSPLPNLNYDLSSTADQVFAYDYNVSGKQDHLVFYRPGTGIIWIFQNSNGALTPVYISSGIPRVTISGQVTSAGAGLPGVNMALSGGTSNSKITDANGNYSFSV